ncbi:hypothetical protein ACFOYW_03165 [Gryllotalpicola reticulitermitis]|uniref:Mannosyltransferase n=1 Tax=Gryllotalpicola reticulitermitis TaxID=1184153 RepID=A0ABV8Q4S7_9MICO
MSASGRAWVAGAIAALLSFAASWVPSYWADEVATLRASALSPGALLDFTTTRTDAVHALFYLVMHYWTAVFGASEGATRGLSALGVGVATALTMLLADALQRPRLGLVAAVLFALMPRVTEAGEEARSYAWTAAIAAGLWLLLLVAMKRGRWWWVALGTVAALSVSFFLLSATLAVAQFVFVAVRQRRALLPVLAAWAAAAVVASPVIYFAWHQRSQVAWLGTSAALNPWSALLEPWAETSWGFGIAASVLLIWGAVRWRAAVARACPEYLLLAGSWVVVPLVLMVATSLTSNPLYTPRYLTLATPGFALLLAAAAVAIGSRRVAAVAVLIVVAVAVPTYVGQRGPYGKNGGSDLRQLADTVRRHAQRHDGVVFEPSPIRRTLNPRLALYAYPQKFAGLDDVALKVRFPHTATFHDQVVPLANRKPQLRELNTVWVVFAGIDTPCNSGKDAATLRAAGFVTDARYPVHRTVVCRFARQ